MQYEASHSITCGVAPAEAYGLIADSSRWPDLLEPCESVRVLATDGAEEHIEISARVNGELMTWQSRRRFLPEVLGIEATVVRPMKLVKAMTTTWRVVALDSQQSVIVLEHQWDLCDDVIGQVDGVHRPEEAARFIEAAIDGNSTVELGNLKAALERPAAPAEDPGAEQVLRHSIACAAPADAVYAFVRSTDSWPWLFDSCTGVTVVDSTGDGERVRVEALQGGRTVSWETSRRYHDAIRRVDYELPVSMPLVESMRGEWRVVPLGAERCLLTVDRRWRMLSDVTGIRESITTVAEATRYVHEFVDGNAAAEMLAIRAMVEEGTPTLTSTTARFRVPHAPDRMYSALADVAAWPKILDHCEVLDVHYDDGHHQEFSMEVRTPAGAETFRSVRHCDEQTLTITYFQPQPPPTMVRHSGSWEVRSVAGGSEVAAKHTALLDPVGCGRAFGGDDLRQHKRRVRELLDRNSRLTVEACSAWLAGAGDA